MTKTRLDCIAMAFRRLGVLSFGETPTADEYAFGEFVLDGVVAEIEATQSMPISWTTDTVPDAMFLPVSYLLAVDMAPAYEIAPRDNRAQMIGRIRAYELPDDRDDRRDLDDDGTITDAEIAADARSAFY